jgi:hypothetical protein
MDNPTELLAQPRIDTLAVDAVSGATRRRTEYAGTAWFGARPQLTGFGAVTRSQAVQIQSPFFLPDSLPYRSELAGTALVVCTVAVQSAPDEAHQVLEARAALVADPRNPVVSWLQVQLVAIARTPIAISYRVDVLVPPEGVFSTDAPAG